MLTPAPGQSVADAIGRAARGFNNDPLTFLRHLGLDDVYHRGPTPGGSLYVIPGLWMSMPTDLQVAIRARRLASVTGRCPSCDTTVDLGPGEMRHESDCNACDDNLRPMLIAWNRKVGRFARGRRIVEDPA